MNECASCRLSSHKNMTYYIDALETSQKVTKNKYGKCIIKAKRSSPSLAFNIKQI